MEYLEKLLSFSGGEWATVITAVALLFFLFVAVVNGFSDLTEKLGIQFKSKDDRRLDSAEESVQALEETVKTYQDNRVHDREQSFRIQKELTDAIQAVSDQLQALKNQIDDSEKAQKKRVRAELKDRIGQAYRYYNQLGSWNSMEKEALEGLIEEYEAAGGENSFVHSKVQKEMYTWTLVEKEKEE